MENEKNPQMTKLWSMTCEAPWYWSSTIISGVAFQKVRRIGIRSTADITAIGYECRHVGGQQHQRVVYWISEAPVETRGRETSIESIPLTTLSGAVHSRGGPLACDVVFQYVFKEAQQTDNVVVALYSYAKTNVQYLIIIIGRKHE